MRKKTYYARRGLLAAEGSSKTEAEAALQAKIDWACNVFGPFVEWRFGLLLIAAASANGWYTSIVEPNERRPLHWTFHGQIGEADAMRSLRLEAAQRVWTPQSDDDALIADAGFDDEAAYRFRRWTRLQRDYIMRREDVISHDQ